MSRLPDPPAPAQLPEVTALLRRVYSPQPAQLRRPDEPLGALIRILLAQQNTATVTRRQYAALQAAYPHWEMALLDGPDGLEATLRGAGGGLTRIKADYIYQLLHQLDEGRGSLSLRFLYDLPTQEARAALQAFPGVGQKTASLFLLFEMGRAAMPVENNIQRVLKRLEWVPASWNLNKSEHYLAAILPSDWEYLYHFHLAFIRHGRQICTAKPSCAQCPIQEFCPSAALFLALTPT